MDPKKSLDDIVMQSSKLESMMLRGKPVVPPDSIIRTFDHLRADDIDLVLSQDKSGLVHNNIILRNGEWAKFLLETWLDPLYRSYNFQKAERHALVRSGRCILSSVYSLTFSRNTLFNGTPRYCQSSPSSPNERSLHTRTPP